MAITLTTTSQTCGEAGKLITLEPGDVLKVTKNDSEDGDLTITAPEGVTLQVYVSVRACS